jgi:1-acyl-sn-glycerol-3-phosphate acyltransferase
MGAAAGSILFWTFLAITSLICFPIAVVIRVVTAPFDRRRVVLHRFTCFWASLYTWLNPVWRVHLTGREKIRPETTYVIVSNHLSLLDILVLFRLFRHFKWVSKSENFRVPVIGWNMSLNGYIPLKRGDRESVAHMLSMCDSALAAGNSIMMFPEGTRSDDGTLKDFKKGAFQLALENQVDIAPVVLTGTADALPKAGFVLRGRHRIGVEVLDPLPHDSFSDMSVDELTEHVHAMFAEHVATPPRVGTSL